MDSIWIYLGDLHELGSPPWVATALVLVAILCGTVIGLERESHNKPAGIRTVSLICVGSTIFAITSILAANDGELADRGRIAAQVVTGVGFLGAGAIIRERGMVVGLTTAATIWVVAAIGVLIGTGYAAGGLALTAVVLAMLLGERHLERGAIGPCAYARCGIYYPAGNNKVRLRIFRILDQYRIPDHARILSREGDREVLRITYCTIHRPHRAFLFELAEMPEVDQICQNIDYDDNESNDVGKDI